MDAGILTVAISNLFYAFLFIIISYPLKKRKIKMNHAYGFRITKAFESDENWYKINEYGAEQLIKWSMLLLLIAILSFFIPTGNEVLVIFSAFAPAIVIIPPIVNTFRYASTL